MDKQLKPIGSVVLLKNASKRIMITGYMQMELNDTKKIWDYVGVLYPEGYIGSDKMLLFNDDQIDRIDYNGFIDEEHNEFMKVIDNELEKMGNQEIEIIEN